MSIYRGPSLKQENAKRLLIKIKKNPRIGYFALEVAIISPAKIVSGLNLVAI